MAIKFFSGASLQLEKDPLYDKSFPSLFPISQWKMENQGEDLAQRGPVGIHHYLWWHSHTGQEPLTDLCLEEP